MPLNPCRTLTLLVSFLTLLSFPVGAEIRYSGSKEITISGLGTREAEVDVDADGKADFYLFSDGGWEGCCNSEIVPLQGHIGVASIPQSYYVTRLAVGSEIGMPLSFARAPMANIGPGDLNPPHEGSFANTRGFLGLALQIAGDVHYGWMDVEGKLDPGNTNYVIIVYGWAFETEPRRTIPAGARGNVTSKPKIEVQQPVGSVVEDGGAAVAFGIVKPGTLGIPMVFVVRNTGSSLLTLTDLSKEGPNAVDFALTPLTSTSLAPGSTATFTVAFAPSVAGRRTAAIHIFSNDIESNPFNISLTGGMDLQSYAREVDLGSTFSITIPVPKGNPRHYQWMHRGKFLPASTITTVAGNGSPGFQGDGGSALQASLNGPIDLAADQAGNIYVVDSGNARIRKVDTQGIITTVAGTGGQVESGDGGLAINASFADISGLAADQSGNLYVADGQTGRIRKIDTNGVIRTIAGIGFTGWSGDGGAATNAALYASDLAVDQRGNIFFTDTLFHRVRRITSLGIISTLAGSGVSGFAGDGGPAANGEFNFPYDVAVDPVGTIFIADRGNRRIRSIGTSGLLRTVAGNGTTDYAGNGKAVAATATGLNSLRGIAADTQENLYISEGSAQRIRRLDAYGVLTTVVGSGETGFSGDGGSAETATLNFPIDMVANSSAQLFISDKNNQRIRRVTFLDTPTLTINAVNTNDLGDYALILSGSFGSVTGAIVTLSIPLQTAEIHLESIGISPISGLFGFSISGPPGRTVIVESSPVASGGEWQTLFTSKLLSGQTLQFLDPGWAQRPERFYRARSP